MEQFENGNMVRVLPCKHTYDAGCIEEWLLKEKRCPLCSADPLQQADWSNQIWLKYNLYLRGILDKMKMNEKWLKKGELKKQLIGYSQSFVDC